MELYIDTANIQDIREAASWGIISGVTTNPSLIAKEQGADFQATIKEIAEIVDGPISAEVVSLDAAGMIKEGEEVAQWHPNVVVKIPSTTEGLKAVYSLAKKGIRTNVTLCFNSVQALMAARAGAFIISPFVGRIDDIGTDGMQLIRDIVIYRTLSRVAACPWRDGDSVSETIGGMTATLELNDNTDFRLLQERKEKRSFLHCRSNGVASTAQETMHRGDL